MASGMVISPPPAGMSKGIVRPVAGTMMFPAVAIGLEMRNAKVGGPLKASVRFSMNPIQNRVPDDWC